MIDEVGQKAFSRRHFLAASFCSLLAGTLGLTSKASGQGGGKGFLHPVLSPYFTSRSNQQIQCQLCPRTCVVAEGQRGFCGVRENRGGKYYSLVYGNPCAVHVDPIEKKPFFHMLPASTSFSIATAGCNFRCKFCQNWEISQTRPDETYNIDLPPERVVALAQKAGSRSIAYTYVEPTIFYEYMRDTAVLARKEGLRNVYHSNGFINPGPLTELCKVMDGANVDLKGFTDEYYSSMSQGQLAPVLRALKILKKEGVHLEITNLTIPTQNDDLGTIRQMCTWIKEELGADTPIHFSRFYPLHKLRGLPPTPVLTLEKSRQLAMDAGLEYVYIGNVPGHEGERTYCPQCKNVLIGRQGYSVKEMNLAEGKCKYCGKPIPGVWA
jgi:pyruvate formate lyase activating enzyme